MTDETPVTAHVHVCVKQLAAHLKNHGPDGDEMESGYEATFELIDLPWDEGTEKDADFREGYETCLLDIVNAIAAEWGVELPELKVVKK
jgi:hypothetical protein